MIMMTKTIIKPIISILSVWFTLPYMYLFCEVMVKVEKVDVIVKKFPGEVI